MRVVELLEKKNSGSFFGAHFDKESKDKLMEYIEENKIPNPIDRDQLHVTIIASPDKVLPIKARGKLDLDAEPLKLHIFPTRDDPPKNCLVILLDCSDLKERHYEIKDKFDLSVPYEYKAHVTLSYDVGDFEWKDLPDPSDLGDLHIIEEYKSPFKTEWSSGVPK